MDHITVPKVENVKLVDRYVSKKPANGILYLTATHLIYVEASGAARKETWIALHHIATVEKLPITSLGCPLTLRCKNFRVAHFVLDSDLVCHEVYISLLKLSQPALPEDLYAFSYNPKSSKEMRESGWKLIEAISDFGRMGIPNRYWTITDANRNYEICSTYPPEIVVPKSVTLGTVVGSSKFRSKERVPVLSYLYKENNAAICRCSQPLSGFYTRCVDDELLLEAISQANPGSQFMYVVDTRPKLNAMANRAAGKGYENEDNYANIRFRFMGIENIHVMRNSLQKLLEVCELKTPTMSEFLSGLESSGWLRHIKAIMDAGIFITKAVKVEKASVLVHCSDGWDRTAQVCSVASILLDPFYRTFKGLMILIEKEWISMGHKFSQRVYEKTHSVWPFLVQRKPDFRNPLYKGFTMYGVLNPSTVPYNIKFWCGMYNRFDKGLQAKQSILENLLEIKKQRAMLETDVHELEKKLKARDEPPEEICTCTQLGNLLSQHLGSPLTNPLGFMGIDGDLNTLMENGTLSREGGLRAQMDQVKSQCADLHHNHCEIVSSLRAINISGDVGISGGTGISEAMGISGDMSTFETMGFSEDLGICGAMDISEATDISGNMGISEARGFSGDMGILGDTGISKASTKEADYSKHQ
ncbi:phosphatidylinositol-3,5-bisphosphate 3-phosphatase MTMR8 isoform X8 [Macaca fascicularis]|uniref:phosphatidylinositol-3,5-bisphosphate 3-phosphatase MTMR8 isoform X8 n=1 Tax=Macaca fascicularis TaxID=9541 RepID=UPI003D159AF1